MSSRRTKALQEVGENIELIYDVFECKDFVEIKGDIGGDVVCYRVYFDGDDVDYVCER